MGTDIINLPAVIRAEPADFADIAERIRGREWAIKDGFVAYIHNGRDLLAVKAKLHHGQFEAWCEAEFGLSLGWSKRAIERSMSAAVHFGDKIEALTAHRVPKTVVYAVSARTVPEPVRESLIAKIVAGESVTLTDIKSVTDSAKRESALTPEVQAAEEKKRKAREAREAKRKQDYAAEDAARKAEWEQAEGIVVRMIVARLGDDAERFCEAMGKVYSYSDVAEKVRAALAPPPPPAPPELERSQTVPEDVSSVVMDDRAMRKAEFFAMKQNKNRRHAAR
ncbi:hypothetical protein [Methylobacterium sp. 10]|uniref:hypothetical protein n=1 Tax=Methylobacterium sp. 10 TaxID=1101191 RepID=UPI0004893A7B|nr:hypothetical protein [Methylobacterium sp. 10]